MSSDVKKGGYVEISKRHTETGDQLRWQAQNGVSLQSGKSVKMYGADGGIRFSDHEEITQVASLRVRKIEGPFDERGNKVQEMKTEAWYEFRATAFSRTPASYELKQIKWFKKYDDGTPQLAHLGGAVQDGIVSFAFKVHGNNTAKKLRMYACFVQPDEQVSVTAQIQGVQLPAYIDRYRLPGKNEDGTVIANDMAWGTGTIVAGRSVYSRDQILSMGRLIRYTAGQSNQQLFADFRTMARGIFARGELNDNIERMIARFERNEGGIYEDPVLTRHARDHASTQRFCRSIEDEIAERLKRYRGDVAKAADNVVYFADHSYGHPRFNSLGDTFAGGLTIAVNDVWSYEVQLTEYRLNGNAYTAKYKITLWDHFGLDMPDVEKAYYNLAGFRSWFVLQHLKGYQPFLVKMEFENEMNGQLTEGRTERQRQRSQ